MPLFRAGGAQLAERREQKQVSAQATGEREKERAEQLAGIQAAQGAGDAEGDEGNGEKRLGDEERFAEFIIHGYTGD